MAAYGERGVLDRPNMRVMRWRNGALSGSDLANEPGLGSSRSYQPGEMPMPSKPKPGLTRMHREMNSEATSSGSPLRATVPPKRAKVGQKVQTNQTMQDLDEMNDELKSTKKELDEMTRSMLQMEEDRDMWRKLFEDCNKKQGQEIERLRQEYKERSEQMALTTAVEKVIPARDIPRGRSPMELLTPREMSQTTETRLPVETNRVTIPDPSDTLGDPVVEQTVRKLIETAGRLVANKNVPGSGVTAPYGTIDDTGKVRLSQTVIRQGISDVTPLMGSSRIPERKVRKMPAKKVSRIIDVQKNNQLKYNFTGSGDRSEGLLQSSYLEPGSKPAATTTRDISSDTGRQLGQSAVEFEDLVGHHGDGLWRRDDSPIISDGGTDESREDPQRDDPCWDE